ncbi:unnamed protein product [Arabidopsis lyrata]|uniref:Expressed protein n=1 Tax=Arabidopsis lyrata subsp. lyrata TaxID=81972 RepID=D7KQE0_ARALL|nr:expressed protein [Arabidopsis lyrata subsp. lyrata]CAH8252171.1 unnamed protein product [Arabidopsis lyrata]
MATSLISQPFQIQKVSMEGGVHALKSSFVETLYALRVGSIVHIKKPNTKAHY